MDRLPTDSGLNGPRLRPFSIRVADGESQVIVDGTDITGSLAGLTFVAGLGQVPRLQLLVYAAGDLEGLAEVEVTPRTLMDTEAIVTFLSHVDAELLEKEALGDLGMLEGGEGSFTVALLSRLIAIAQGQSPDPAR